MNKTKIRVRVITAAGLLAAFTTGALLHTLRLARQGRLDRQIVAAVQAQDAGAVAALLDAGADPNARDADAPVLLDAVEGPNDRLVELLLARGAAPNRRDGRDETALMVAASNADPAWGYAASEGRADNIAVLVQAGAIRPAGLP